MPEHRGSGGLLRQRDYGLFWFGESVNRICTAVVSIVLPIFAVQYLDAGPIAVGLLTAATWFPWLLLGLPAGAWVDRLPPRPILIGASLLSAAVLAVLVGAVRAGVAALPHLLATALVVGGAGVFASTASVVFWPALVAPDELLEGNAKLQASEAAALIVGPGVGGLLAQTAGPAAGLLIGAVGFAGSTLCLLGVRSRSRPRDHGRRRGLVREIVEGVGIVARDALLRVLTVNAAVANLGMVATEALLVIFLVRTVGVGAGLVGLLLAGWGVGGLLGALLARRVARLLGTARTLLVVSALSAPFGFLVPLAFPGPGLALFVLGVTVPFVGVSIYNTVAGAFRQDYCLPETLGRVTATSKVVLFGSMPVGALLGGFLGAALGPRAALFVTMAIGVLPALLLLLSPIRHLRDLPTRSSAEVVSA